MPNWVFTTLSVTGRKDVVDKFREQAARPYRTFHRGMVTANGLEPDVIVENESTGSIQFWNFIEPKDKDAYFGREQKPEGYAEMTFDERMEHAMKHSTDHWYDWNIRNWGTKWETCDPYELTYGDGFVAYSFRTAWAPAEGAFRAMAEQFPNLTFAIECIEEQGWGVVFSGKDGELTVEREWDIPQCHKDYVDQGMDCDRCSHDADELYDDCPKQPELTTG